MVSDKEFEASLRNLVKEIKELLSDIIEKTKDTDLRAKTARSDWSERHRLHVLLEAAEEALLAISQKRALPSLLIEELRGVVEVLRRWSAKPNWNEIKPSLVNPAHFNHTIAKFHIAEFFERQGHHVELVPRGEESSPDLRILADAKEEQWMYVECYSPKALNGKRSNFSNDELKQIIKHSMEKAKL